MVQNWGLGHVWQHFSADTREHIAGQIVRIMPLHYLTCTCCWDHIVKCKCNRGRCTQSTGAQRASRWTHFPSFLCVNLACLHESERKRETESLCVSVCSHWGHRNADASPLGPVRHTFCQCLQWTTLGETPCNSRRPEGSRGLRESAAGGTLFCFWKKPAGLSVWQHWRTFSTHGEVTVCDVMSSDWFMQRQEFFSRSCSPVLWLPSGKADLCLCYTGEELAYCFIKDTTPLLY